MKTNKNKANHRKSVLVYGDYLTKTDQQKVLSEYIARYTGDHTPQWVIDEKHKSKTVPLHFRDDVDWLHNTRFYVTSTGKLDGKFKHCESYPTFPFDPEYRRDYPVRRIPPKQTNTTNHTDESKGTKQG